MHSLHNKRLSISRLADRCHNKMCYLFYTIRKVEADKNDPEGRKLMYKLPTIKLPNGQSLPMIGLGTFAKRSVPGQYRRAVEWAIETGYRHIDTGAHYSNEDEVGEAINNMIHQGVVTRQQIVLTTKLWNDRHQENQVMLALSESLARLRLDYVDLYLIHWPVSHTEKGEEADIDYLETWSGMEHCLKEGVAKTIGVSNFNQLQLDRLLQAASIKPAVNQIEVNATMTNYELVNFCKQRQVIPIAYTPLGLLSNARPEYLGLDLIKKDVKLGDLAEKYGKSRVQINLRYLIQRGIPVIPKSFNKTRIKENLDVFDFKLTDAEMKLMDSFNMNHRCVPGTQFRRLKNYPFARK